MPSASSPGIHVTIAPAQHNRDSNVPGVRPSLQLNFRERERRVTSGNQGTAAILVILNLSQEWVHVEYTGAIYDRMKRPARRLGN
eukprot:363887-Chlamydomonas_euryale.AAC.15